MRRLVQGLKRTKDRLFAPLQGILSSGSLDDEVIDEVEALLLSADLGIEATDRIIERLREEAGSGSYEEGGYLQLVARELLGITDEVAPGPAPEGSPRVIVIIGVNGVGKTSTIGKLAHLYMRDGKSVMLAACDTFRAAAIEQLGMWAQRVNAPLVRQDMGADPAAVAFDAVQSAISKNIDIVLIDTAGRLHTKTNLMEELGKIFRVISQRLPDAGLEAWLVLDANTGQNSLRQAEVFTGSLPVTGIVLTKLDSTAKGGAIIPIQKKLGVPVVYVGVGEGIEDMEPFDHRAFISALLGDRVSL
jgi:fused signal recognition particle receptor